MSLRNYFVKNKSVLSVVQSFLVVFVHVWSAGLGFDLVAWLIFMEFMSL